MRLQVFLSHNGVCSRRKALILIAEGRVTIDGRMQREPSTPVNGTETIAVDGNVVVVKAYHYILLNKPVGVTTTKDDPHADKTVMDLLPLEYQHLSPVGRLDRDSAGLLLLTNDGDLAFRLTHPSFHEEKKYEVIVNGEINKDKIKQLSQGILIKEEDGASYRTLPCQIADVDYNNGQTKMTMIIREGRKRQIRLMMRAIGHQVKELTRVAMGTIVIGDLPVGHWRYLDEKEVLSLKK